MKKRYSVIIILMLLVGLGSCDLMNRIDEIEPKHQQELGNVMTDSASAESLLRNVYQQWRGGGIARSQMYMSLMSGALVKGQGNVLVNGVDYQENKVKAEDLTVGEMYKDYYKVINIANVVIELLEQNMAPDLSVKRKEEMIAECKFHRAMAHFGLLRSFGQFYDMNSRFGIVVRETSYPSRPVAQARASVKDVYTSVLNDLKYAVEKAPKNIAPDKHYYISRLTAKALKAKVLLCMGNYPEAESVAGEVIREASGYGYELEEVYDNVFVNSFNSKEVLFATYCFGMTELGSNEFSYNTTYGSYTEQISLDPDFEGEPSLDSGEGYDWRFGYAYNMFGPDLGGNGGSGGDVEWGGDVEGYTLARSGVSRGGDNVQARTNNTYPYPDMVAGRKGNTVFFLRLAEMYYIHAEAAIRNGNYDPARSSLKSVLTNGRTSLDIDVDAVPDNALLEFTRKNKWIELFAENNEEWFDMVRYYKAGDLNITSIKGTITKDNQLILPLPKEALAGNNLLEVNP